MQLALQIYKIKTIWEKKKQKTKKNPCTRAELARMPFQSQSLVDTDYVCSTKTADSGTF